MPPAMLACTDAGDRRSPDGGGGGEARTTVVLPTSHQGLQPEELVVTVDTVNHRETPPTNPSCSSQNEIE